MFLNVPRLRLIVALALALGAGLVAACGSGASRSGKTLRVGVLGPFTGPVARTGDEFKSAVRHALRLPPPQYVREKGSCTL